MNNFKNHNSVHTITLFTMATHISLHVWYTFIESTFCFNSFWPSEAIWHRSGSTLAQVMACCLMAPSYQPNQWWLIINKVLWHSSEDIMMKENLNIPPSKIENCILKLHQDLPEDNELTNLPLVLHICISELDQFVSSNGLSPVWC